MIDLFDLLAPTIQRRCGTCVHRNSNEDGAPGYCEPGGEDRAADQLPCEFWHAFTELRNPLYGGKR